MKLRRYLPIAMLLLGYLTIIVGLATFDPRLTLVAIGAIGIYEGREATK